MTGSEVSTPYQSPAVRRHATNHTEKYDLNESSHSINETTASNANPAHRRHGSQRLDEYEYMESSNSNIHIPAINSPGRKDHYGSQFALALTIAGVAFSLLFTVFGIFHVDVFLRAYRLPLQTYSFGNVLFAIIYPTSDFLGAWLVDSAAANRINRSDLIGISGFIFSLCFLTPFFRWKEPSSIVLDGAHFVVSMSLHDTLYSFTNILLGSLVTDDHSMTDSERVWFMQSGNIANLVAAFVAARIGLLLYDEDNLKKFRAFLVTLAVVVALLFATAQAMTHYSIVIQGKLFRVRFLKMKKGDEHMDHTPGSTQQLKLRQVISDFWNHKNFWAWIGMELFLESQVSFVNAFLKTFVDKLIFDEGVSREWCDWLVSLIRPLGLIFGILIYIPIRRLGYKKVYPFLFAVNASLCLLILLTATHKSTSTIIAFLIIYPTLTSAVSSAGFHLVMSDMVLEMKRMHVSDGRFDEPSLAALFMGMNALFCKPAQSILPVVAASLLGDMDLNSERYEHGVQEVLFQVLVIPPLIFSLLEWASWRRYTLTPAKALQMRAELMYNQRKQVDEAIL